MHRIPTHKNVRTRARATSNQFNQILKEETEVQDMFVRIRNQRDRMMREREKRRNRERRRQRDQERRALNQHRFEMFNVRRIANEIERKEQNKDKGCKPEQLNRIPEYRFDVNNQHLNVGNQNGCSICLDDYKEGQLVKKLECSHIFHKECLEPWLLTKNKCPMCLKKL
jgi:hypothetical protein